MLQAAVAGLEPVKPYVLALTSNSDGTGRVEPIAEFTTNGAGAQVVSAVGPIRQIVDPSEAREHRRYLAIIAFDDGKLGQPVGSSDPKRSLQVGVPSIGSAYGSYCLIWAACVR